LGDSPLHLSKANREASENKSMQNTHHNERYALNSKYPLFLCVGVAISVRSGVSLAIVVEAKDWSGCWINKQWGLSRGTNSKSVVGVEGVSSPSLKDETCTGSNVQNSNAESS
jgi:hypothetical protein